MKLKITLFIAAVLSAPALVTAAAALGDTTSGSTQQASKGALVALGKTELGNVLVDARGRTLYRFEKDTRGRSACHGACATYWPPLLSSADPRVARGVRFLLLGSSKRTDGTRQVTYAGRPLYTFFGDTKAGQTTGVGLTDFGAAWYAVAASGRAVKPNTSSGVTAGGYGSYGSGR